MPDRKTNAVIPNTPREKGMRDWSDNISGEIVAARLVAFNPTTLLFQDVTVDNATGGLVTSGGGGGSGGLTDAQLRASPVPVDATPTSPVATDYLPVRLTDGTAFYVAGGGGGGTQYAEDTVSAAADLITMAGVVRKDVAATLVDTDGDRAQLQVDAVGRLHVNGSGVTQPVSGTFWQATQPVSGTVSVSGAVDTELPAAVALADNMANPTVPQVGSHALVWDGATWDRETQPLTDAQLRATAVPVSGTFWQATQPVSLAAAVDVSDRAARLLGVVDKGKVWDGTNIAAVKAGVVAVAGDNPLVVTVHPSSAPTATQPVSAASLPLPAGAATEATLTSGAQVAQIRASTLVVTATGAAAAAVTATLPAVAGQFHYITRINIVKYASVATVGAAAPTVITSTNLPGSLAWTLPTALAVGTQYETDVEPSGPLKSSVVNTATTIVAAGLASIIYRITVYYYTAT